MEEEGRAPRRSNGVASQNRRQYEDIEPEKRNGYRKGFEEDMEEERWGPHRNNGVAASESQPAVEPSEFLDVNLVAGLLRWAFQAKNRLGHERLMDLIELYLSSSQHSRELGEAIVYVCTMVNDDVTITSDPAQECVDLLHQLHGILAGGISIRYKPRMIRPADEERSSKTERMISREV